MGSLLSERTKIVGCLAPQNVGNVAFVSAPVKLDAYQKCSMLIYLGTIGNATTIVLNKGNSSSPATAMAFNYRIANGTAANCQLNGALTSQGSGGLIVSNTTYPTSCMVDIEINAQDLGSNYHFVGVNCNTGAGAPNLCSITAILSDARYNEDAASTATVLT